MSEVKQVEFTEDPFVIIYSEKFYPGDRKSFPVEEADEYIRLGWAKDPVTGEQGERKPGAHKLTVQNVVQKG